MTHRVSIIKIGERMVYLARFSASLACLWALVTGSLPRFMRSRFIFSCFSSRKDSLIGVPAKSKASRMVRSR